MTLRSTGGISSTGGTRLSFNKPPVWITAAGSLGSQHETETTTSHSYVVEAQDPDNFPAAIVYSVVAGELPTGASLHPVTGAITGPAIPVDGEGVFNFTVRAFDATSAVERAFSITVENNTLPVFSTGTALGTLHEAATITSQSITIVATDVDNKPDPIEYTYGPTGTPPTASSINLNTGAITGPAITVGTDTLFTFDVTADDGEETTIKSFELTVTNNTLPVFVTAGGSVATMVDGEVYSGTTPLEANDSDGLPMALTYTTGDAIPTGIDLSTGGVISGTVTDASITQDTLYTFTVTADDGLDVDTRQFSIQVNCNVFEASATHTTFVTDMNTIHGTGTGNAGYGQSDFSAVTEGNCVVKTNLTDWRTAVVNMETHQGITLSPVIADLADINTIPFNDAAGFFATLKDDNLPDVELAPATVAGGQLTTTASKLASARTASWATQILHQFTVTFADSDAARHFFNTGGQIRFAATRSGGSSNSQNTAWTNLVNANSPYVFDGSDYFVLTNSANTVLRTVTSGGAYASNTWKIEGWYTSIAGGLGGHGSVLRFVSRFTDGHSNVFFDSVNGTFTSTIGERRCTGVFTQTSPTFSTLTAMTAGS